MKEAGIPQYGSVRERSGRSLMSKKNRLSRDQKRKAKLAKESRRARQDVSPLAYEGKKYKRDDLVPVYLATETAILEAFAITDRQLTDRVVRSALERLILQLRQGPLPPEDDTGSLEIVAGQEEDFIIRNIRRHWLEVLPWPRTDDVIGVLRTTLNSINVWGTRSHESRGYLNYVEGFLKKGGVSVRAERPDEEGEEPEEPELLEIGEEWCETGDREAEDEFRHLALEMIRAGEAETVVDICQRLAGGLERGPILNELLALSLEAQRTIPPR
jgi:hypothetical protein